MTRIERQPDKTKESHSVLKGIGSFFSKLIKLPFKVTIRFIVLAILLTIFVVILRTGIWHVSVVSDIVYREPNPIHEFDAEKFSSTMLLLKAEEALFQSSSKDASIHLSEGELTSLVRKYTDAGNDTLTDVHLSILPEYIEVYGRVGSKPHIVIRARMEPVIIDNNIEFDIDSILVGQVAIPKGLISSKVISWITPPLFETLIESIRVDTIALQDKSMILTIYSQ